MRRVFFISLCFSFFQIIYSQNSADSLRIIWKDASQPDSLRFKAIRNYESLYGHSEPDSTLKVLEFYYQLAKEKNALRQMYRALNLQGNIYRLKEDYDKALFFYERAITLTSQLEYSRNQVAKSNENASFVLRKICNQK